MYLGSDALALAPFTDLIAYLEEGDWVGADPRGRRHSRRVRQAVVTRRRPAQPGRQPADREGQLPPLHGQGNSRAAGGRRPHARPLHRHGARQACSRSPGRSIRKKLARITICACGTAYMAGLIAKYWIERFARLPVEIDVASEYRYREAPVDTAGSRSSFRNRARRPTRWRRCATRRSAARRSSASSMCRLRASRG